MMVVAAHRRILLEQRRVVRVLDVLLDGHQAFLAHLLQDLEHQREQFEEAPGVLAALEALPASERGARAPSSGCWHERADGGMMVIIRTATRENHADVAPCAMNTPKMQPRRR